MYRERVLEPFQLGESITLPSIVYTGKGRQHWAYTRHVMHTHTHIERGLSGLNVTWRHHVAFSDWLPCGRCYAAGSTRICARMCCARSKYGGSDQTNTSNFLTHSHLKFRSFFGIKCGSLSLWRGKTPNTFPSWVERLDRAEIKNTLKKQPDGRPTFHSFWLSEEKKIESARPANVDILRKSDRLMSKEGSPEGHLSWSPHPPISSGGSHHWKFKSHNVVGRRGGVFLSAQAWTSDSLQILCGLTGTFKVYVCVCVCMGQVSSNKSQSCLRSRVKWKWR